MSWNLLTVAFGGDKYKQGQTFLNRQAEKSGLNHIAYTKDDIFESELVKENEEWFSKDNGYGWFAWKPYAILKAMENLEEGDKIFYIDTLDIFHPDIFKFVDGLMGDDPCLLCVASSINKHYTKKDCFVYMDCDDSPYWNSGQLEAGFGFWKVCDETKDILNEWLEWCLDEKVNGELTSFSNLKEEPGFVACRHDQSILTNMAIRDGLCVCGTELLNWMECNADYWYERHARGEIPMHRDIDRYLAEIKDTVDYL